MEKEKNIINKFRRPLNKKKLTQIIRGLGYKGDEKVTREYCSKV